MYIYGFEDLTNKNELYKREITFHLLRSDIYLTIINNVINIEQRVHCNNFCNENITSLEQEKISYEKSVIEYFIKKYEQHLYKNIPLEEIIAIDSDSDDPCFVYSKKLTVTKVEDVHDKVCSEIRERSESLNLKYKWYTVDEQTKRYLKHTLGINNYPIGNKTIRFYILLTDNEKKYEVEIDVNFDNSRIIKITVNNNNYPLFINEEEEVIKYFFHKYFNLFSKNIPLTEIIKKDNNKTIIYKPSIVCSTKRLLKKLNSY